MEVLYQDIDHYLVGCSWQVHGGLAACVRKHAAGIYRITGLKLEKVMQTPVEHAIDQTNWQFDGKKITARTLDGQTITITPTGASAHAGARNGVVELQSSADTVGTASTAADSVHVFKYRGITVTVSRKAVFANGCDIRALPAEHESLLSYAVIVNISENQYLCEDKSGRICICTCVGDLRNALNEHV